MCYINTNTKILLGLWIVYITGREEQDVKYASASSSFPV